MDSSTPVSISFAEAANAELESPAFNAMMHATAVNHRPLNRLKMRFVIMNSFSEESALRRQLDSEEQPPPLGRRFGEMQYGGILLRMKLSLLTGGNAITRPVHSCGHAATQSHSTFV
jgi:hypothetical protein